MNRKVLVLASVVLVGGAAAAVFAAAGRRAPDHPHPAPSGSTAHGSGIDRAMGALLVMYKAPPGNTPCESAYNAFRTSQDYATENDAVPVVLRLAPRDEFLRGCAALPPATQQCMVPAYLAQHRSECVKAKPSQDVLDPLVELKQREEPGPSSEPVPQLGAP